MALNDAMDRARVRLAVERSVATDETQFFYDKVVRRRATNTNLSE
jgi:hypothetical protein